MECLNTEWMFRKIFWNADFFSAWKCDHHVRINIFFLPLLSRYLFVNKKSLHRLGTACLEPISRADCTSKEAAQRAIHRWEDSPPRPPVTLSLTWWKWTHYMHAQCLLYLMCTAELSHRLPVFCEGGGTVGRKEVRWKRKGVRAIMCITLLDDFRLFPTTPSFPPPQRRKDTNLS